MADDSYVSIKRSRLFDSDYGEGKEEVENAEMDEVHDWLPSKSELREMARAELSLNNPSKHLIFSASAKLSKVTGSPSSDSDGSENDDHKTCGILPSARKRELTTKMNLIAERLDCEDKLKKLEDGKLSVFVESGKLVYNLGGIGFGKHLLVARLEQLAKLA